MLSPQCMDMIKAGRGPDLLKVWTAVDGFVAGRLGEPPFAKAEMKLSRSKSDLNWYNKGLADGKALTSPIPPNPT